MKEGKIKKENKELKPIIPIIPYPKWMVDDIGKEDDNEDENGV